MTTATQVKPVKKGLGTAVKALWSTIQTILEAFEAYASAFKEVGLVAELTAKNYKEEAIALHEQEMQALRDEA